MDILERLGLEFDTFAGCIAVVTSGARGISEYVPVGLAHLGEKVVILDVTERRINSSPWSGHFYDQLPDESTQASPSPLYSMSVHEPRLEA